MENFKENFLSMLGDDEAVSHLQLIFEAMFKTLLSPLSSQMNDTIRILSETVADLKKDNQSKDAQINNFQAEVNLMKTRIDDLEQHREKDTIRIFGLSECTPGSADEKELRSCNEFVQLQPPLSVDEITVSHSVGRPLAATDDTMATNDMAPAPPRPMSRKFCTEGSKNGVRATKKSPKLPEQEDAEEEEFAKLVADGTHIYEVDDLTKAGEDLKFKAGEAKRNVPSVRPPAPLPEEAEEEEEERSSTWKGFNAPLPEIPKAKESKPDIKDGLSNDDFIAQQRALSRNQSGPKVPVLDDEPGETYDEVESPTVGEPLSETNGLIEDELYEVPIGQEETDNDITSGNSSTDYEDYDEDDSTIVYENQAFQDAKARSRSTKRKSSGNESDSKYRRHSAQSLQNTAFTGTLYQKPKLGAWPPRWCALLQDGVFLMYKNQKSGKPLQSCSLQGYDVMYMEKDGKRNDVLRLSHPGKETLWFSCEGTEMADQWVQAITMVQSQSNYGNACLTHSSSKSDVLSEHGTLETQSTISSSSEGGSGDGVILPTPPNSEKRKQSGTILGSLSNLFGRKQKGEKPKMTIQHLEEVPVVPETDTVIQGNIEVTCEQTNHKWTKRRCVLKSQGMLVCYKESNDEEVDFTMSLRGVEIQTAIEGKRQLAVKLIENNADKIVFDFPDSLKQGAWLTQLIKETGFGERTASDSNENADDDLEDIYDEVGGDDQPTLFKISKQDCSDSELLRSITNQLFDNIIESDKKEKNTEKKDQEKTDAEKKVPPPLPTTNPPIKKLREVGDSFDSDDGDEYYCLGDDSGIGDPSSASSVNYAPSSVSSGNYASESYDEMYHVPSDQSGKSEGRSEHLPSEEIYEEFDDYQLEPGNAEVVRDQEDIYEEADFEGGEYDDIDELRDGELYDDGVGVMPIGGITVGESCTDSDGGEIYENAEPDDSTSQPNNSPSMAVQKAAKSRSGGAAVSSSSTGSSELEIPPIPTGKGHVQARLQRYLQNIPDDLVLEQKDKQTADSNQKNKPTPGGGVQKPVSSLSGVKNKNSAAGSKPATLGPKPVIGKKPPVGTTTQPEQTSVPESAQGGARRTGATKTSTTDKTSTRGLPGTQGKPEVRSTSLGKIQPGKIGATVTQGPTGLRFDAHTSPTSSPRKLSLKSLTDEDLEVIKCHEGPTIEQDRELFQATSNPILSQLRKERSIRRSFRQTDRDKMESDISDLKVRLIQIRRKKAELRGKKIKLTSPQERQPIDTELRALEREYNRKEAQLHNLQAEYEEKLFASQADDAPSEPSTPKKASTLPANTNPPFRSTQTKTSTLPSDSRSSYHSSSPKNSRTSSPQRTAGIASRWESRKEAEESKAKVTEHKERIVCDTSTTRSDRTNRIASRMNGTQGRGGVAQKAATPTMKQKLKLWEARVESSSEC